MKKLLLVSALAAFANPARAQDIEAMAKWTSYKIVHYKVVGEFSGETILVAGPANSYPGTLRVQVTDRIEVEFDWDQEEFNLVGKPVIRNFPTKLDAVLPTQRRLDNGQIVEDKCPAPKLDGTLEFVTGLAVKTDEAMRMSGVLTLEVRRDQPGGSIPAFGETGTCGGVWETAKPVSETSTMGLMAVPGMYLVMPMPDAQGGMKISADKKSIIIPAGQKGASNYGWTWTYTPTGVK